MRRGGEERRGSGSVTSRAWLDIKVVPAMLGPPCRGVRGPAQKQTITPCPHLAMLPCDRLVRTSRALDRVHRRYTRGNGTCDQHPHTTPRH
eukprot:scaffold2568_cov246-Pinguiococcus_pyrenoidosus.AAC.5